MFRGPDCRRGTISNPEKQLWVLLAAEYQQHPHHPSAQRELYQRCVTQGRGFLRAHYRDLGEADADDVLLHSADALMRVLRTRTLDDPHAFFITCCVHAARSVFRSRARLESLEDVALTASTRDPIELIAMQERLERSGLDERSVLVFQLELDGMSRPEIAETLGISRAYVDQIVSRARKKLRDEGED